MNEKKDNMETSENSLKDFIMNDINRQLRIRMQNADAVIDKRDKDQKASKSIQIAHRD